MSEPPRGEAPPGVREWLAGVDPAREESVRTVQIGDRLCVVKRRRRSAAGGLAYCARYLRALLLAVFCRVFLGEFPSPRVLLRNGLADEARRLRSLRGAGCRVPAVLWEEPEVLVLEFVGDDLPYVARRADPAERRALLEQAAGDLAAFHRAGHAHGGAQLRNMTVRGGELWRIDFEENIGGALSRPLAQAYDVFQMLASLVALRRLPADELSGLGTLMLERYLQAWPDPDVRRELARLGRALRRVAAVPGLAWLPWRDVQGFLRVAALLQRLPDTP